MSAGDGRVKDGRVKDGRVADGRAADGRAADRHPAPRLGAPPDAACAALVAGLDVVVAPPRDLARRLALGELDLALLPPQLYAAGAERFDVVPGLAAGSDGPCGFARLEARGPLAGLHRVAGPAPGAPADGHAAEALVRVLFAASGTPVEIVPFAGTPEEALAEHGARVVAGDEAQGTSAPPGAASIDLGEAWSALTGRPFVWWLWAARPGRCDRATYGRLHGARTRGRFAPGGALPAAARVRHRLGLREVAGIELFLGELARLDPALVATQVRFAPLGRGAACRPPRGPAEP